MKKKIKIKERITSSEELLKKIMKSKRALVFDYTYEHGDLIILIYSYDIKGIAFAKISIKELIERRKNLKGIGKKFKKLIK